MLASQAQDGASMAWTLDPTLSRYATYTQNSVTYTNHFSDGGNSPSWTSGSDGSWTRNVTDFDGLLAAQVTAAGVTLELPDLHGDIMATATTSPTSTGPTSTYIYSEFGAPENATPGAYGELGGNLISDNALGGELLMGARTYNPSTGRFSQVDPIPGGSANAYDYASQNPITHVDLSGQKWVTYATSLQWYTGWEDILESIDKSWWKSVIFNAIKVIIAAITWLTFTVEITGAWSRKGIYNEYQVWQGKNPPKDIFRTVLYDASEVKFTYTCLVIAIIPVYKSVYYQTFLVPIQIEP
jgi:RHS repeat-associated protein